MSGELAGLRAACVGGGTGQPRTLRALRSLGCDVTAVVAMADDGGSTGALRREMGVVPPGDVRNCLVALAAEPASPLARAMQCRLPAAGGHALGNLLLATLGEECGSFLDAVALCERMLGCVGRVIPSTVEPVRLRGVTRDGREISGEDACGHGPCTLQRAWLEPAAPEACPQAVAAIMSADLVVVGPGSLFTSIIPNALVPGIAGALRATRATRVFVCPKSDRQYESWGLSADEYVEALYEHGLDGCIDAVLVHHAPVEGGVVTRTFRALTADQVAADAAAHARRASLPATHVPSSREVVAAPDVLARLHELVPVVVTRDFTDPADPMAHDVARLAAALASVSGCRRDS